MAAADVGSLVGTPGGHDTDLPPQGFQGLQGHEQQKLPPGSPQMYEVVSRLAIQTEWDIQPGLHLLECHLPAKVRTSLEVKLLL